MYFKIIYKKDKHKTKNKNMNFQIFYKGIRFVTRKFM